MTSRDRHRHDQADAAIASMANLSKMSLERLQARRMELVEAGCALQSTDDPDTDGTYARQDAEIDRQIMAVKAEIARREAGK